MLSVSKALPLQACSLAVLHGQTTFLKTARQGCGDQARSEAVLSHVWEEHAVRIAQHQSRVQASTCEVPTHLQRQTVLVDEGPVGFLKVRPGSMQGQAAYPSATDAPHTGRSRAQMHLQTAQWCERHR